MKYSFSLVLVLFASTAFAQTAEQQNTFNTALAVLNGQGESIEMTTTQRTLAVNARSRAEAERVVAVSKGVPAEKFVYPDGVMLDAAEYFFEGELCYAAFEFSSILALQHFQTGINVWMGIEGEEQSYAGACVWFEMTITLMTQANMELGHAYIEFAHAEREWNDAQSFYAFLWSVLPPDPVPVPVPDPPMGL